MIFSSSGGTGSFDQPRGSVMKHSRLPQSPLMLFAASCGGLFSDMKVAKHPVHGVRVLHCA